MTRKAITDAECVEQLRASLDSLDEAIKQYQDGALQLQPSRQFGAELLRGVLREVDRLRGMKACTASAWFTGTCKACGSPVVVTGSWQDGQDYLWYCSNKTCGNHTPGVDTGDMESPDFVVII